MPIMRKKSGFPTVALGKLNGTNWGESKPNGALDVTAFVVGYDMTLTGGTLLSTTTTAPNVGNPEKWDIGWGDGSYDIDNEPTSRVTSHTVSSTATGQMRFLGWNGSPSKVRVGFTGQQYLTTCTKLGNFVLDQRAFNNCDNFDFSSASLDNTYVATAINMNQAFRFSSGITTGIEQLKIDFAAGTVGPGSMLQGTSAYLGENLNSWNTASYSGGSWNRFAEGCRLDNLSISNWDLRTVTNTGNAFRSSRQNADWTDVFPTGSVCTDHSFAFSRSDFLQGTGFGTWDVSACKNFAGMFDDSELFNGAIGSWDVSNGTNFSAMFNFNTSPGTLAFTATIEDWTFNTSSKSTGTTTTTSSNQLIDSGADFVTDGVAVGDTVKNTSTGATTTVASVISATTLGLNHDIFKSTLPYRIFTGITVAQMFRRNDRVGGRDLSVWNMDNVTSISNFFESRAANICALNFDLSGWERTTPVGDTSTMGNVTNMGAVFFGSGGLTQANLAGIQDWDVSGCATFANFASENTRFGTNFDTVCDVSNWVLRGNEAINMSAMWSVTPSCPTGFGSTNWNTGLQYVANISRMFDRCTAGNPDCTGWDVSHIQDFTSFLASSAANRNYGSWDLSSCTTLASTFAASAMSDANIANTLVGWEAGVPNTGVNATNVFGTKTLNETTYSSAKTAYDNLIASTGSGGYGWTITGITWVT